MKYHFFRIPVNDPDAATEELNRFLTMHRIVTTDRQFIADGENSSWSVCVTWVDQQGAPRQDKKQRVDYREVLNPTDFRLFAKLRDLRKEIAAAEGVPVYALFTNEQLAGMVCNRVKSATELAQIDGVGAGRLEKYGPRFLGLLLAEQHQQDSGNQQPHETDDNSD